MNNVPNVADNVKVFEQMNIQTTKDKRVFILWSQELCHYIAVVSKERLQTDGEIQDVNRV